MRDKPLRSTYEGKASQSETGTGMHDGKSNVHNAFRVYAQNTSYYFPVTIGKKDRLAAISRREKSYMLVTS